LKIFFETFLCFILLLLPSHSQNRQNSPDLPTQPAKVYFYRVNAYLSARRATINVDRKEVCSLTVGRYFELDLPPGEHAFSGPDVKQTASLNLEPGKAYYFKASPDTSSVTKMAFAIHNVFRIDLVPAEVGDYDVKRLKQLDPSDIKDGGWPRHAFARAPAPQTR